MKGPECDDEIAGPGAIHEPGPLPTRRRPRLRDPRDGPPAPAGRLRAAGGRGPAPAEATGPERAFARARPRGQQRIEPELSALSRPPLAAGGSASTARRSWPGPDHRRGAGETPSRVRLDHRRGRPRPDETARPGIRLASPSSGRSMSPGTNSPLLLVTPAASSLVGRGALAGRLHAVHPVPGPGKRRSRDSLGGGIRGIPGGLAPRSSPPVPPQEQPGRGTASSRAPPPGAVDPRSVLAAGPVDRAGYLGPGARREPLPARFGLVVGLEGPGLPGRFAPATPADRHRGPTWSRSTPPRLRPMASTCGRRTRRGGLLTSRIRSRSERIAVRDSSLHSSPFRASRTRWGSSGRMIFVIASSTAAREPGMTRMDLADQSADGPAEHAGRADLA